MKKVGFIITLLIHFSYIAQNGIVISNNGYIVIDNGAHLVIENPSSNAIQTLGTGGNILSESYADVVDWKIGANMGNYTIPFTTVDNVKIPLTYQVINPASGGNVLFSTYRTANNNNPLPPNTSVLDGCLENNSLYTIDRFWRLENQNYIQLPEVNLSFGYDDGPTEMGGLNNIIEARLKAERYNSNTSSWEIPEYMYGTANTTLNQVQNAAVTSNEIYPIWTLVDTNSVLAPELETNFTDTTICFGKSLTLVLSGADTYQWDTSGITPGITIVPQDSARYQVIGENQNGCTDTLTLNVNVAPLPTATFSVLTPIICQNECAEINNNSFSATGENLTNMHWYINDVMQTAEAGVNEICNLAVDNYDLAIVVEDINGCKDSLLLNNQIAVKPLPSAGFSTSPDIILVSEPLSIFNQSSPVVDVFYTLDNDNEIYGPDAEYIYETSGVDTIMQVVSDKYGCTDTAYYEIHILGNENVYVPNSFSPNDNGRNDVFFPVYSGSSSLINYELFIFNRWGEQLFYSNNLERGWDGTYNGSKVKQGVYVYQLRYRLEDGLFQKRGHVSVLK